MTQRPENYVILQKYKIAMITCFVNKFSILPYALAWCNFAVMYCAESLSLYKTVILEHFKTTHFQKY